MVEKELSMTIGLTFDTTGVNWQDAAEIFEKAPLGTRAPDQLKKAYDNSDLVCFAWDGSLLVGMGRALSDGVYQSVIYDLCMLPDYQGQRLGSRILEAMMERLKTENYVLWSVPGKEGFYSRFGFQPMLTAMARFKEPGKSAANGYIKIEKD